MLSRRNIRVKAMQVMYMHEQNPDLPIEKLEKTLKDSIHNFYRTFVYNLYVIIKTAEFVNEDAIIRAGKFLPTEADKNVSVKLFHNPVLQKLVLDEEFIRFIRYEKLEHYFDKDYAHKFFHLLAGTNEYKNYVGKENSTIEDDKRIIQFLYKKILFKQELFHQLMEDIFPNWPDDTEVISFAVLNFISQISIGKIPEWQTDLIEENKFATELLDNTFYNEEYLTGLITPKLKNWDKERLAQIDLLLMKLALAEIIYFPNIPVKVSINEYIEISKLYSTPKSGDFINGVLDRLMKELQEKNVIKKTGRGLVEK